MGLKQPPEWWVMSFWSCPCLEVQTGTVRTDIPKLLHGGPNWQGLNSLFKLVVQVVVDFPSIWCMPQVPNHKYVLFHLWWCNLNSALFELSVMVKINNNSNCIIIKEKRFPWSLNKNRWAEYVFRISCPRIFAVANQSRLELKRTMV